MNTATHPRARATAEAAPSHAREPVDRERLGAALAVSAGTPAAVLAAVMHTAPEGRPDAPRLALAGTAAAQTSERHALAACADCGVVEAVVPVDPPADEAGPAWQVRIRMDDGTVRTVEQRRALAAGSRVTVAGGSIRVLSNRPGQG